MLERVANECEAEIDALGDLIATLEVALLIEPAPYGVDAEYRAELAARLVTLRISRATAYFAWRRAVSGLEPTLPN